MPTVCTECAESCPRLWKADKASEPSFCSWLGRTSLYAESGFQLHRKIALCLLLTVGTVLSIPATTSNDFKQLAKLGKLEIVRAVAYYAKHYQLDPALLLAVVSVESDFRQDVISSRGAVGLMQLMPQTAISVGVTDINDPVQNIRGGAMHLRQLLNLYRGDLALSLAAYNAGIHRVKRHKISENPQTRAYVRKVLKHYHRYQGQPLKADKTRAVKRTRKDAQGQLPYADSLSHNAT